MKDMKVRNLKTNEVTTAYKIGLIRVMNRIDEMNQNGEQVELSSIPKDERLHIGLNYIQDNEDYEIID